MRITVLGTGALACLFGARLARRADVVLLGAWRAGIAAIQREGIRIESAEGETRVRVRATADALDAGDADLVLVLVKSWQTGRAVQQAGRVLRNDGLALTLQNGLGNYEALADAVGESRAALGVTTQGAALLEPGRIRYAGGGDTLLGFNSANEGSVRRVAELLQAAGFSTQVTGEIAAALWGKLAVNAGINPVTALLGVANGALLERADAEALMVAAAQEAAAVAAARGIELAGDAAARVREVARLTAANRSSMLQDVTRGAPTEIDAISGAVVRAGQQLGVPTPVNEVLWRLVRAVREA
ncbi:MAG: ketopantoate reductase family protein [Anaerolineales bacterium]